MSSSWNEGLEFLGIEQCRSCTNENDNHGHWYNCGHFHCSNCLPVIISRCSGPEVPCRVEGCNGYMEAGDIPNTVDDKVLHNYLDRITANKHNTATGQESGSGMKRKHEEMDAENNNAAVRKVQVSASSLGEDSEDDLTSGFEQVSISTKFLIAAGYSEEEAIQYLASQSVLLTVKPIKCNICLEDEILPGDGIIIKNCLHMVCRDCLTNYISANDFPEIECPCTDGLEKCREVLLPLEVRELCSQETYEKHYVDLSLKAIEQSDGMAHCMTPNCPYFCDLGDQYIYTCPQCRSDNCYRCKVQHNGLTCRDYQRDLQRENEALKSAEWDKRNQLIQRQNDQLSQAAIENKLKKGSFRPCPKCKVLVEKNRGCDHMICAKCNHNYNWSECSPSRRAR